MRLLALFAIGLGIAACSPPTVPTAAASPGPDATFRAKLERGMCLGPCPVYAVEIDAAGLVTFTGQRSNAEPSVPCQGQRQWRVSPEAVARLEATIDQGRFFTFRDDYSGSVTDMPGMTVTITRRGMTKRVIDYMGQMVGMPPAMIRIEDAIDIAANTKACVVAPTPRPSPSR